MRSLHYHDVYITIKKDRQPAKIYRADKETDILSMLEDDIQGSKSGKSEYFIAFLGLKYYTTIIINYLYKMGFILIQGKVNKNDLRVGQYRLRQTPNGQTYYIQIKTGYKSFVTYQAVDPVISLRELPGTTEDAKKALQLYHYTRDRYLDGIKKSETRILYSSASISRTLLGRHYTELTYMAAALKRSYIYDTPEQDHKEKLNVYLEKFCRPAVHGGVNFFAPRALSYTGEGIVLDCNSLYPFFAAHGYIPLPNVISHGFSEPRTEYLKRKTRYYTIMKVEVSAELKNDGIACICPDSGLSIGHPDYLTKMTKRILTLSPSDREMLFDNYKISYYRIKEYITFTVKPGYFRDYVQPNYTIKKTAQGMERDFVKMMLNGFIGTFARHTYETEYIYEENDGFITPRKMPRDPEELEEETQKISGLAFINIAIVSQAKAYMIKLIKKHYDHFLYTDTDSIHMAGREIPTDIKISLEMGDFKVEHTFTKCFYRAIKNYMLVENDEIVQCVAGMPKDALKTPIPDGLGLDKKYITKAIQRRDLSKLYEKPIGVYAIDEDIKSGTISLQPHKAYFKKLEKKRDIRTHLQRVREQRKEWYDNNVTMPKAMERYQKSEDEKATERAIRLYNKYGAPKVHGGFAEAVEIFEKFRSIELRKRGYYQCKDGSWWCNRDAATGAIKISKENKNTDFKKELNDLIKSL